MPTFHNVWDGEPGMRHQCDDCGVIVSSARGMCDHVCKGATVLTQAGKIEELAKKAFDEIGHPAYDDWEHLPQALKQEWRDIVKMILEAKP